MNELLEQFRKEELELFNRETGELYSGITISSRQCELMRDVINDLESRLIDVKKIVKILSEVEYDTKDLFETLAENMKP